MATATATAATASVQALRAARGVVNMPTRAIAAVLLRARAPVSHEELYRLSDEYALFYSRRHFKRCLRMMRDMQRVRIRSTGPQYPGANKQHFVVELTRRGETVYENYLGASPPLPHVADADDTPQGLAVALDKADS